MMIFSRNTVMAADCCDRLKECDQVVDACDKALTARKRELTLANIALLQSLDSNASLQRDLNTAEDKLKSVWRQPTFTIPLGITIGVIGAGYFFLRK